MSISNDLSKDLCSMFKIEELFLAENRVPYAKVSQGERVEVHPVYSEEIGRMITRILFEQNASLPSKTDREKVQHTLAATADITGNRNSVWVRVAETETGIEIDLNNKSGSCIKVTKDGWSIEKSNALFYRPSSSQEMIEPQKGGGWEIFQKHFPTCTIDDLRLIIGYMIACFRPHGPYASLVLQGEQGSAKSTTALMIKSLVDPSIGATRGIIRKEHDLFIAAKNNHLLSFDNISLIKNDLSDSLCRLATGGSFSARTLYTNDSETLIEICKPVLLNGITDFVNRADLISRSIIIELPSIPEEKRKNLDDVIAAFEKDKPFMLGILMDGLVAGLKNKDSVKLENKPRMADLITWCTAAEAGLGWETGSFLEAFQENQLNADLTALANDSLAIAVQTFATNMKGNKWKGTATALLKALELHKPYMETSKSWPSTPQYLSQSLMRLTPSLKKVGISVHRDRASKDRYFVIEVTKKNSSSDNGNTASFPMAPVAPSYLLDDWRTNGLFDS